MMFLCTPLDHVTSILVQSAHSALKVMMIERLKMPERRSQEAMFNRIHRVLSALLKTGGHILY